MTGSARIEQVIDDLGAETRKLARGTRLRICAFIAMDLLVFAYLFWIFQRIRPFTNPLYVADTVVELGRDQVRSLIDDAAGDVAENAENIVRESEDQLENWLVSLRQQLQNAIGEGIGEAIATAMAERDGALMSRLRANPNLALAAVASDQGAQALVSVMLETDRLPRGKSRNKSLEDALRDLAALRDRVEKLQRNRGLSDVERAERRLLLAVLGQMPSPAPEPGSRPRR